MAQQLEATVGILLVAVAACKSKASLWSAARGDRHTEGIVRARRDRGLVPSRLQARRAQVVVMVERRRARDPRGDALGHGRRAVRENRRENTGAIALVRAGSRAVDLPHPRVETVVREGVGRRARVRDLRGPPLVVVAQTGCSGTRGDGRRPPRRVVGEALGGGAVNLETVCVQLCPNPSIPQPLPSQFQHSHGRLNEPFGHIPFASLRTAVAGCNWLGPLQVIFRVLGQNLR